MNTPKLRFKNDNGNEYPEWVETHVSELTLFHKQGYYTNKPYVKQGIKLARVSDLFNPEINYLTMPMLDIPQNDYELFKVEKDDFLIARSGSIGRYGIVTDIPDDEKIIFGSFLIKFRFNQDLVKNRFFGIYYDSPFAYKQLARITQAGANININAENIEKINIPLPCLQEQQKIADFFSILDQIIKDCQAEIEVWEQQKKRFNAAVIQPEDKI